MLHFLFHFYIDSSFFIICHISSLFIFIIVFLFIYLQHGELKAKINEIQTLKSMNTKINEELEKQKSKLSNVTKERLTNKQEADHKCRNKDFLIRSLADLLITKSEIRPSTIVNRLRETTCKPSFKGVDFTLDSLCHFLETSSKTSSTTTTTTNVNK